MARPALNQDIIIKRFRAKHGDFYDYSLVVYRHIHQDVTIICPFHGEFHQKPYNHCKAGCRQCAKDTEIARRGWSLDRFLDSASSIHGSRYCYGNTVYKGLKFKVEIKCRDHGIFWQEANSHLSGAGCPQCDKSKKLDTATFVERAVKIHNGLYSYEKVDYQGLYKKVIITCKIHGDFLQAPTNHLAGNRCNKCASGKFVMENEWLDHMNIPDDGHSRQVRIELASGRYVVVDGIDHTTSTIYEFLGDRWHGNPRIYEPDDVNPVNKKTYAQLYALTCNRRLQLEALGYSVVEMWEQDWKLIKNQLLVCT